MAMENVERWASRRLCAGPAASAQPAPAEPDGTALEDRMVQESGAKNSRFAILAHRPNYLLAATYTTKPENPAYNTFPDIAGNLDKIEMKYQISFKAPLLEGLFSGKADVYAAYTQLALWQAYNARISAPFRETNYEPEAFIAYRTDISMLGARRFNHQSNGQIEPLSRSWNRIIIGAMLQKGKNYFFIHQWTRMPERAKDDDNPRIGRYMGYGDLIFTRVGRTHSFSVLLRNNLQFSNNKGAVQVDWTFPLHKKFRGYVQLFNGYDETLISYDMSSSRIGLGVSLSDWL